MAPALDDSSGINLTTNLFIQPLSFYLLVQPLISSVYPTLMLLSLCPTPFFICLSKPFFLSVCPTAVYCMHFLSVMLKPSFLMPFLFLNYCLYLILLSFLHILLIFLLIFLLTFLLLLQNLSSVQFVN